MKQRWEVPNGVPLLIALLFAVFVFAGIASGTFTEGRRTTGAALLLWIAGIVLTIFLVSLAVRAVKALESIAESLRSERADPPR